MIVETICMCADAMIESLVRTTREYSEAMLT